MELWQQLGHASFGDWRRASEKARRAAKKAARVVPPPAAGRFETPPELRFAGRGALRLRAADRARLEANVLAFVKEQRLRAHIGMLVRAGR